MRFSQDSPDFHMLEGSIPCGGCGGNAGKVNGQFKPEGNFLTLSHSIRQDILMMLQAIITSDIDLLYMDKAGGTRILKVL